MIKARHGEKQQRWARSTTGAASLGGAALGKHLEKTRGPKEGAGEGRGKREKEEEEEEEKEGRRCWRIKY